MQPRHRRAGVPAQADHRRRLIDHGGRWIAIRDWDGIREVGDFNPLYLHLDQVAPRFHGSIRTIFEQNARVNTPDAHMAAQRP